MVGSSTKKQSKEDILLGGCGSWLKGAKMSGSRSATDLYATYRGSSRSRCPVGGSLRMCIIGGVTGIQYRMNTIKCFLVLLEESAHIFLDSSGSPSS